MEALQNKLSWMMRFFMGAIVKAGWLIVGGISFWYRLIEGQHWNAAKIESLPPDEAGHAH